MSEKVTRISLTLPEKLLNEFDRSLEAQRYVSRSEAIRDALRDFLTSYKWRKGLRGEQTGAILIVYEHDVHGLTEKIIDIEHRNSDIVNAVQHLHLDAKNCLEVLIVKGSAGKIRRLIDHLGSLRGVKQTKLVVI
jgi:CopG family nickel-responsive transcriptional regulator